MTPFGLFKKQWQRELCSFVLQEYGATGSGRGWANITESTEAPISKLMASEYYKPGKHYRVMARWSEGDHAGQIAAIVWEHYVPVKGLAALQAEEGEDKLKPKKEKEEKQKPKGPEEIMDEYAEKLTADLQPIVKLQAVLEDIRTIFAPKEQPQAPAAATDYEIPPPEYEGKLPIWTHPAVIKAIFGELNAFVDNAANRFQEAFGGGPPSGKGQAKQAVEEEEEELLPSISKFAKSVPNLPKKPEPIVTEEEETLPPPGKKPEQISGGPALDLKVQPPEEEEDKAETTPSLFPEEEQDAGDIDLPHIDDAKESNQPPRRKVKKK